MFHQNRTIVSRKPRHHGLCWLSRGGQAPTPAVLTYPTESVVARAAQGDRDFFTQLAQRQAQLRAQRVELPTHIEDQLFVHGVSLRKQSVSSSIPVEHENLLGLEPLLHLLMVWASTTQFNKTTVFLHEYLTARSPFRPACLRFKILVQKNNVRKIRFRPPYAACPEVPLLGGERVPVDGHL
jgi:hypothetical protein